jgi:regulator of replication initiation timing
MEYAEVGTFNKIVAMAFGSDHDGESGTAFDKGKKFLRDRDAKITDFKLVLANSEDGRASGLEHWERQFNRLFRQLDAKDNALQSVTAEADALRRECDELRAKLKTRVAAKPAKAEADTLRAKVAKLETTLAKTMAESDEANRARDEADARADAARRENDELRAALQEATAELREAQRVADVRRDAMSHNGRADAAGAATDNPTSGVEAEGYRPEAAQGLTDSGSFDEIAAEEQSGWNPNFNQKAVGLYWCTVQAINADLAAGRITTRQASGRKAAAHRSYKVGAKLGSRARNARRAA